MLPSFISWFFTSMGSVSSTTFMSGSLALAYSQTSTNLTAGCLTSKDNTSKFYGFITSVWDEASLISSSLLKFKKWIFGFPTLAMIKKPMQTSERGMWEIGTLNVWYPFLYFSVFHHKVHSKNKEWITLKDCNGYNQKFKKIKNVMMPRSNGWWKRIIDFTLHIYRQQASKKIPENQRSIKGCNQQLRWNLNSITRLEGTRVP